MAQREELASGTECVKQQPANPEDVKSGLAVGIRYKCTRPAGGADDGK